jgi:Na+-transporting methylmalonyl-CoA/oxaloacetate decarboxylase gamma subunit
MSSEQPEVRWAPLPPAPKRTGRVWLLVGLGVAVVAIVLAFLIFVLPGGFKPEPTPTASPSPTATTTAAPTPTATPDPEPSAPATDAPTPPDPDLATFRDRVAPWLDDAATGLEFIGDSSTDEAQSIVSTLQEDAQRLSDAQPPSAIAGQWHRDVDTYLERLSDLESAVSSGADTSAAVEAARASLELLRDSAGL